MGGHKVLFVHQSPSALGGSEQTLLASAAALRRFGWLPALLHGEHALDARVAELFVETIRAPGLLSRKPTGAGVRQTRLLNGLIGRYSLAHVHLWPQPILTSWLTRRLPTVVTCHVPVCPNGARYHFARERSCDRRVGAVCLGRGYFLDGCAHTIDDEPFGLWGLTTSLFFAKLTLRSLQACSTVVAPSTWQRERLIADGVDPRRAVVIPPPLVAPPRDLHTGNGRRTPVVLMVGRLASFKGGHHLLKASASLGVSHEVWIAGDGPAKARLESFAGRLGIADRVRFLGTVSAERREAVYASAAVVAVPSLWGETFGMVGPEAMRRGIPVVGYDHAGMTDWIAGGRHAIAVRPGDSAELARALERVLTNKPAVQPTRERARLYADSLDAEEHAAALDRLYRRVTAAYRGGARFGPPASHP